MFSCQRLKKFPRRPPIPSLVPLLVSWLEFSSLSSSSLMYAFVWGKHYIFCKGCSRSNTSHFIKLSHYISSRYWWHGSRCWTFLPITHFLFVGWLWQQLSGSLTKWCLTWKCISRCVSFIDTCWTFMQAKTVNVSIVR